ncbi:MAG TPA: DUF1360 domain-containing protein [Symbiobacteriaceae bacterium]|nr:DUF1360 domain-containing protein [Symbiobacteriaceae bacterium]
MTWFELALLILASFRLTHLIVFDSIMEPIRERLGPVPFIGELITCYWCCGVWASGLLVGAHLIWPAISFPLILLLAVAGGQAIVESLVKRD